MTILKINDSIFVKKGGAWREKVKQIKRIEYLDYAKAIAIVLVMLDHRDTYLGVFVCCALPLFFMSSGITTNIDKYSFKDYLMHNTKRLLPPFWVAMLVYTALELIRGPLVGYGDTSLAIPGLVNTIYGSGKFPVIGPFTERLVEIMSFKQQFDPKTVEAILPLNCHLWYLTAFYSGCAVFFCCKKLNKRNSLAMDGLMIVVLLFLTAIEVMPHMCQLPYGLGRGFLCAAYMLVGSRIKSMLAEENKMKIALAVIVSSIAVEYNLDKAKKLAKEVLGDKRCEIIYCINGAEIVQKGEAELIAYWLKEIGLDVKIQSLEYATMSKQLRKGEYNLARLQRGLPNGDPYIIFDQFMTPNGAANVSSSMHYHNDEIVRLLGEVKHVVNENKRHELYNRMQEISVIEQPVIPLFNDKTIMAYNKHLKNYDALIYGINLAKVEYVE